MATPPRPTQGSVFINNYSVKSHSQDDAKQAIFFMAASWHLPRSGRTPDLARLEVIDKYHLAKCQNETQRFLQTSTLIIVINHWLLWG